MADTTVTFTIPSAQVPRVINDLCVAAGLPVSAANAKQAVINWVAATCQNVDNAVAQQAALAALTAATAPGLY